jgi:hypothetical protein
MTEPKISTSDLESLSDLDWFDKMCSILEKSICPTTQELAQAIGTEDSGLSKENRGSKFLIPFDKRFKTACINPDITNGDVDRPIDYLSFGGTDFNLKMVDILQRFPNYKTQSNIYDGGTQIFFYPLPKQFEFAALSFHIDSELENIGDINSLNFQHLAFHFGDNVVLGRDGYHVRR